MRGAELNPVLDALADEGLADSATVVLVGSGARGVRNPRSDIDVLVLHGDDRRIDSSARATYIYSKTVVRGF